MPFYRRLIAIVQWVTSVSYNTKSCLDRTLTGYVGKKGKGLRRIVWWKKEKEFELFQVGICKYFL